MLVLTRRVGECIRIGDDITVTILGSHRTSVKIGIVAPASVSVDRNEIYARKQAEKGNQGPAST